MANNQEFNSIDELFRKSFNDLPATPANNGWDTPSDRVWQNINANVQPTSGGWSAGTKWLAAVSISALVLVGAYWAFNRPEPAATIPATPVEQPAVAPTQPAPAPVVTEMPAKAADNTASAKTKGTDKPGKTPTVTAPATEANNNGAPKNSAEKTKEAPNSIEKRKLEQVKQQQF